MLPDSWRVGEMLPFKHGPWVLALASALLVVPSSVPAHPHVWATVRSEIVLGPNHQITGIRHSWTFDEFYTAMAVEGLDTNKDGIYSKEELSLIHISEPTRLL